MSKVMKKRPKILCIQSVLTDHIVALASLVGDVVLVYGKNGILRQNFSDVRVVQHTATSFGARWLLNLFFPKSQTYIPRYMLKLHDLLEKEHPSIILTSEIFELITWQCVRYARQNGTRLLIISETKGPPKSFLARMFLCYSLRYIRSNLAYIESIIVWTKQGQKWYAQYLPEANIVLVPAPVDTELFYPAETKGWLPRGYLRIIMNARYIPLKEHRTLFLALKKLSEQGVEYRLTLIGRGGNLESELKEYAEELGISENLIWLEPVPMKQLREIYVEHDVLVLPSNREAIGMVVPEAMACGIPTITSEAVGANTYVVEGKTGFIFKTGSAASLAATLKECLDRDRLRKMGEAGAREIQAKYSLEILGKNFKQILQSSGPQF